ncbi:MAG: hypothetical protein AAF658_22210, partial [Myxococcota bacterium]
MKFAWMLIVGFAFAGIGACSDDAGEESTEDDAQTAGDDGKNVLKVLRERYTVTFEGKNVDGELCINGACIAQWENGSRPKT